MRRSAREERDERQLLSWERDSQRAGGLASARATSESRDAARRPVSLLNVSDLLYVYYT